MVAVKERSSVERTNPEWLADLRSEGPARTFALDDLAHRLERGIFYYLRYDRSDLSDRTSEEIQRMAQDAVQDALLKILDKLDTFRGESRFTTWATKIAVREAMSELRRARYQNFSLDQLTFDGALLPDTAPFAAAPHEAHHPEQFVELQEVSELLRRAIDCVLTEKQRTVLTAVVLEGVPYDVVAERMGTNRNALYKVVHDARLKLKEHLSEQGLTMDYLLRLFGGAQERVPAA